MNWSTIIIIDLPSLQSIRLGKTSLRGERESLDCSLVMRSIKEMM